MITCLFIGGPADGKIIGVEDPSAPYRIIATKSKIVSVAEDEVFSWHQYYPNRFAAGNFETVVYSLPEIDGGMILNALIQHYHKNRR